MSQACGRQLSLAGLGTQAQLGCPREGDWWCTLHRLTGPESLSTRQTVQGNALLGFQVAPFSGRWLVHCLMPIYSFFWSSLRAELFFFGPLIPTNFSNGGPHAAIPLGRT